MNDKQPRPDEANSSVQTESDTSADPASPQGLAPQVALELLVQDPVGFIQHIVNHAAQVHLTDLKEEAELKAAINVFRRTHPEFSQFEPFIMQEVVSLIQNNPESATAPWPTLLENAMNHFKQKFADAIKNTNLQNEATSEAQPPFMEAASNRSMPEIPPSFTREQIAGMSLNDFLKQEGAINAALKEGRIR